MLGPWEKTKDEDVPDINPCRDAAYCSGVFDGVLRTRPLLIELCCRPFRRPRHAFAKRLWHGMAWHGMVMSLC